MASRSYRDLVAWQKGMDLVEAVHLATRDWPKEERFGLTDQVRRAVVSVPANVAEGQGRGSRKDFLHFCAWFRSRRKPVDSSSATRENVSRPVAWKIRGPSSNCHLVSEPCPLLQYSH